MANRIKALSDNVTGNLYVDSTCINCGVSRHYAPDIFGDSGTYAFVKKQPETEQQMLAAHQALLACPMASIGTKEKTNLSIARNSFPIEMTKNIYLNGYNHRDSYGAHSYLIKADSGNWLIDSPRFVTNLVDKFEQMGGIQYIFLSHRDDVSDAHRFAKHFGAKRIIHSLDSEAQQDAELILNGIDSHHIDAAEIFFTPGHTQGHLVLLWKNKFLFSGDHYAWISELNQFASFRNACWYSWDTQIESVQKMISFKDIEWVFPGHVKWGQIATGQFPEVVQQSVEWMQSVK